MTKTKRPLFMELANLIGAIENCEQSNNYEWMDKHTEKVVSLSENNLPHGSQIGIWVQRSNQPKQ